MYRTDNNCPSRDAFPSCGLLAILLSSKSWRPTPPRVVTRHFSSLFIHSSYFYLRLLYVYDMFVKYACTLERHGWPMPLLITYILFVTNSATNNAFTNIVKSRYATATLGVKWYLKWFETGDNPGTAREIPFKAGHSSISYSDPGSVAFSSDVHQSLDMAGRTPEATDVFLELILTAKIGLKLIIFIKLKKYYFYFYIKLFEKVFKLYVVLSTTHIDY